MEIRLTELERRHLQVLTAIRRYANHQPLDVKSPREIQRELLAIAGDEHVHVASTSDACLICGRDLRDDVHIRADQQEPEKVSST